MNFPRLASLLRNLLHKQREERELDEEVRAHEQLLVDENIQAGMNPQEARRQARLELGGVEQVKEQVRDSGALAPSAIHPRTDGPHNVASGSGMCRSSRLGTNADQ